MDELKARLEEVLGLCPKKFSYLIGEDLTVHLSSNNVDYSFDVKLRFNKVLGFHCVELLNAKINFIDVGPLGFKYLTHARQHGHDVSSLKQIVLMGEKGGTKSEIIVVCSDVSIERRS